MDTRGTGERADRRRVRPTMMPDRGGVLHAEFGLAAPRRAVGARPGPRRAVLGLAADPSRRRAVPVVGARPLVAQGRRLRRRRAVTGTGRRPARAPFPR